MFMLMLLLLPLESVTTTDAVALLDVSIVPNVRETFDIDAPDRFMLFVTELIVTSNFFNVADFNAVKLEKLNNS